MNIGIIGSGGMGTCLASRLVKLGYRVSLANSRGPLSLKKTAQETGAEATTLAGAIRDKQVIIVSIPVKNVPDLPKDLFRSLPKDVVVIDTGNYYPTLRDNIIPALEETGIDSLWVQQELGVPIIKVFNSILADSLNDSGRSKGEPNRIAMAISGDDATAKAVVSDLVEELGFDPFDLGNIGQSWRQQPGSFIYCRDIHLEELKKRADTMGTDWPKMRDVIIKNRIASEALMKADYPAYLESLKY